MTDICLIDMPFADIDRPSLALGLLQSILKQADIETVCVYANIRFAEEISPAHYSFWETTLGDLIFARVVFPNHRPDIGRRLMRGGERTRLEALQAGLPDDPEELTRIAERLRTYAGEFVDRIARYVLSTGARVVGCTSTFQQHTASLGLLRRIREVDPSVTTMMGGANCEAVMGQATHRNFPWVDYVVSGEADDLIVSLCKSQLAANGDGALANLPHGVFGPQHRRQGYPRTPGNGETPRAVCHDLDALPLPDYADYFRSLEASAVARDVRPGLLIETSRGCWYGQRKQCTFCGISPLGMVYKSKNADRVLMEFTELERRHGIYYYEVTDNILSMDYFKTVLPHLAEGDVSRKIFWESKANLKREQVHQLALAGVRWLQPGIESLDTRILNLMNKGVQGIQNVRLMKWCREFGVRLAWNQLFGFPGEQDDWYLEVAGWMEALHHLQPPRAFIPLRFDRDSVYFARAAEHGFRFKADPAMALTYPLPQQDLDELAYYFVPDEKGAARTHRPSAPGLRACLVEMQRWQKSFWRGLAAVLTIEDDGTSLTILDTRPCAERFRTVLTGMQRRVYLACEDGITQKRLIDSLADDLQTPENRGAVLGATDDLCRLKFLLKIDGQYLGLAVRGDIPTLLRCEEFPGGHVHRKRVIAGPAYLLAPADSPANRPGGHGLSRAPS